MVAWTEAWWVVDSVDPMVASSVLHWVALMAANWVDWKDA